MITVYNKHTLKKAGLFNTNLGQIWTSQMSVKYGQTTGVKLNKKKKWKQLALSVFD